MSPLIRPRLLSVPVLAATVFVAVWIIALLIQPAGAPEIDASDADIAAHYESESARQVLNSFLVHGVAAVALILVIFSAFRFAQRDRQATLAMTLFTAAAVGVIVSLVQLILGVTLALTADIAEPGRAGTLFDAINRLDGVKMLAFAAMAGAGAMLAMCGTLSRWLSVASLLLGIALVVSAIGYLMLDASLAMAAFLSLPLLLIWVSGVAVAVRPLRPS